MTKDKIYRLGTGNSTVYFKVVSEREVSFRGKTVNIQLEKFLDFIHTAELLGLEAGEL